MNHASDSMQPIGATEKDLEFKSTKNGPRCPHPPLLMPHVELMLKVVNSNSE